VIIEAGELLVQLYGENDPSVGEVVNVIKGSISGNMQWSAITARYHSNLVYDCVVELA